MLIIGLTSLLIACIVALCIIFLMNRHFASKGYKGEKSDHFDGKRFYNVGWNAGETFRFTETEEEFLGKKRKNGLLTFFRWILNQRISFWKKRKVHPVKPVNIHEDESVIVTYIGHATVLIQTGGLNILTDPVWAKRASPVKWFGPKRYTEPGVHFSTLPKIDLVLLSHNHYDHMDIVFLKKLAKRDKMPIYTGLGNAKYLTDRGIKNSIDMDWWETQIYQKGTDGKKCEIIFIPSQHFSARGITDRNKTLWGGFAWKIVNQTGYFAGDTGYGPFVKKIEDKFPNGFDIGLLPIGAYNPRWFMAAMHTSPFEGMQMQKDLRIKKAIGIHYGTFPLAADLQDEPIEDLIKAKEDPIFQNQWFEVGESGTSWKI